MKLLIAYAGKYKTTKECVRRLTEGLRGLDVTVANLEEAQPSPAEYDLIVFGSSVYFGKLRPAAREYLKTHEATLAQKKLALFLCCGLTEESEYYCEKLFPAALREKAFLTLYFGGSLSTEGLSFRDKLIVRSMRSSLFAEEMENGEYILSLPGILPENIDKLATYIRKEMR